MSRLPASGLARLVRRVRTTLWLGEIARVQQMGLWTAAAILTSGALSRWHYGMPTPPILAGLVSAPVLLALAVGLGRRPRWETALLAADRRAGADALLATACGLPPAPTGASALVLAQARRALPRWQQRIRAASPRPGLPKAPIVAMLAAAPLLALQPAADPSPPEAPQARATTPAAAPQVSLQAVVAELRKTTATTLQPASRQAARPDRPASQAGMPVRSIPPATRYLEAEVSQPGANGPRAQGSGQTANGSKTAHPPAAAAPDASGAGGAGRDVAGTGSVHPPETSTAVADGPTERGVPVMRQGTASGGVASGGMLEAAVTDLEPTTGPKAPPAVLEWRAPVEHLAFTPAQRRLIARYFTLLEEEEGR